MGKVWGYVFGDYAYVNHADQYASSRANSNVTYENSTGATWPQNYSAFDFRRIYLGYDYSFAPKFSSQLTLANEEGKPNIDQSSNRDFYIKYASIRWKGLYHNADLVIGQQQTVGFVYSSEMVWGYRAIEKTITDLHGLISSTDLGVSLMGKFNNEGTLGYDAMVGNNNGAKLPTSQYKRFYGDLWASLMDHKLIIQIYGDGFRNLPSNKYDPYSGHTSDVNDKYWTNTMKAFAAYTTPRFTFGVEYFMQNTVDGLRYKGPSGGDTSTIAANGLSIFARGQIIPGKLAAYAMYDLYTNDKNYSTNLSNEDSIAKKVGGYSSYNGSYNESFLVAGLDFMPNKNLHIMPNVWYYAFDNKEASNGIGYLKNDNYMVYRITFYYTFNKAPMMPSDK